MHIYSLLYIYIYCSLLLMCLFLQPVQHCFKNRACTVTRSQVQILQLCPSFQFYSEHTTSFSFLYNVTVSVSVILNESLMSFAFVM